MNFLYSKGTPPPPTVSPDSSVAQRSSAEARHHGGTGERTHSELFTRGNSPTQHHPDERDPKRPQFMQFTPRLAQQLHQSLNVSLAHALRLQGSFLSAAAAHSDTEPAANVLRVLGLDEIAILGPRSTPLGEFREQFNAAISRGEYWREFFAGPYGTGSSTDFTLTSQNVEDFCATFSAIAALSLKTLASERAVTKAEMIPEGAGSLSAMLGHWRYSRWVANRAVLDSVLMTEAGKLSIRSSQVAAFFSLDLNEHRTGVMTRGCRIGPTKDGPFRSRFEPARSHS